MKKLKKNQETSKQRTTCRNKTNQERLNTKQSLVKGTKKTPNKTANKKKRNKVLLLRKLADTIETCIKTTINYAHWVKQGI
jgi:hypothetical protein